MRMNDIVATIALKNIKGVGNTTIKKLWKRGFFKDDNFYTTIENCLKNLNKKPDSDHEIESWVNLAQETILSANSDDIKILHIADPIYPVQLTELRNPPALLFYKGNLDNIGKVIGIIGTREPDSIGVEVSKRIGSYFHDIGYSICNGLALGIDEASIKRGGSVMSNVIGVLGGGLNYNQRKTVLKTTAFLAEQVLEAGGLLISEFECDIKEDQFKIIKSCRLQAGLSHGLILVQSKIGGGSKYTIEAFCSLDRPLGVLNLQNQMNDLLYEANKEIIKNYGNGLTKMTGLSLSQININNVRVISSKADYALFETDMIIRQISKRENNTLFE